MPMRYLQSFDPHAAQNPRRGGRCFIYNPQKQDPVFLSNEVCKYPLFSLGQFNPCLSTGLFAF